MVKYLFFLLIGFPLFVFAQEDENRYISPSSVPLQNGEIVYTKNIKAEGLSEKQLFDTMLSWCEKLFVAKDGLQPRVLLTEPDKGQIVCQGMDYLEFKHTTWVLDRAEMRYRLYIYCSAGECELKLTDISYKYDKYYNGEFAPAEDFITDKYALNKKKTELTKMFGKFRVKTVDLVDGLFGKAEKQLARQSIK